MSSTGATSPSSPDIIYGTGPCRIAAVLAFSADSPVKLRTVTLTGSVLLALSCRHLGIAATSDRPDDC